MKESAKLTNQKMGVIVSDMKKEKRNNLVHYIFLNISGMLVIGIVYLVSKYPDNIGGFGGSFMLFLLIISAMVSAHFVRAISLELSSIPLIITGVMGINFLGFWEMIHGVLNSAFSWLFIGCFFWTLYWFLFSLFILLKPLESLDESNRRLKNQLTITLFPIFLISMIFIAITYSTYSLLQKHSPQTLVDMANSFFFKYTTISTGGVILGLFISLIYLLKINDRAIRSLIIEEKCGVIKYTPNKLKRYFIFAFSLVIIIGSIIETQRGMWVMWIETILLIVLMSLIIWKIYKHVFYEKKEKQAE